MVTPSNHERASALMRTLQAAAIVAGCRPPALRIKRMRNACYNPFLHRVALSRYLAQQLPSSSLDALIAHEVRHAAQRREILLDGLRVLSQPLAALMLGGAGAVVAGSSGSMVLAALLGLATILLTIRIDAITGQQWDRLVQTRELEADAFAARFTGSPEAVRVMLQQCVDLEDDGVTGTALSARMTILQAAYGAASTGKSGV